ncbi:MAG: type II toxin-antitoxin system PemK/MazF family toxin [Actinobacteria bacterium]|nr:type II toxin-antitoxin system PemK/MazF family toxin [Actinomycetota bacterium]
MVLSKKEYNQKSNLAIICPITSKIKDYPFEVRINSIKGGIPLTGVSTICCSMECSILKTVLTYFAACGDDGKPLKLERLHSDL